MKKVLGVFVAAVLAFALAVTPSAESSTSAVSSSKSSSSSSTSASVETSKTVTVGTANMTAEETTYANNAVAWERSQGNTAIVIDVPAGYQGDITVAAPVTTTTNVFAYKLHNGETVTVPVVSVGSGYVVVHSDGNNCPYVIVAAGTAATTGAAAGTSPKTGLY